MRFPLLAIAGVGLAAAPAIYAQPAESLPPADFTALFTAPANREAIVQTDTGPRLITAEQYRDFELRFESRTGSGSESGVRLRGRSATGELAQALSAASGERDGQWNHCEITMLGERVTVIRNGLRVADNVVLGGMPDPVAPRGPIELWVKKGETQWRNVWIRRIGTDEANRRLAASGDPSGFVEHVNGRDLSNWQGAVGSYEMKSGAIVCRPRKGGDLLTKEEFENGVIRVEYRLSVAGNNGIALRTPLIGHSAANGFEIQVLDDEGYNALQAAAHQKPLAAYQYNGSLYYCVGAKRGYQRPVGEWNFEEIEVRGQRIRVTLNGTCILDVDVSTLDRSKLAYAPKGLDHTRGYIGLAGHYDPVEFRSFKVKSDPLR